MALRAYELPGTPTQLLAVQNNLQAEARPSASSVNHEVLPDVLLQICTGTRVSLLTLVRNTGYSDNEGIADLHHHRNPSPDGSCLGLSKRNSWMSQHRVIYTAAIANGRTARTDRSPCCSDDAEIPIALKPDHMVSVGPWVSVVDCDHFVRASVPRILGHSQFELLDFFVLPCIPGAYMLPPAIFSAARWYALPPVQHRSHKLLPGRGCMESENSATDTSAGTARPPVGDAASASSLIIITALIRSALLVKSPLKATDVEPGCRVSAATIDCGVWQGSAGLTDRHEGVNLCSTSTAAQYPDASSDDASPIQFPDFIGESAQSLAHRLAATGIWHIPSVCDRIARAGCTQSSKVQSPVPNLVQTAQIWTTAKQNSVRDSGMLRHKDRLQTAHAYAEAESWAQRANKTETVAVRSITLVAYLGPVNQAAEGTDHTTESDLAIKLCTVQCIMP